MNGRRFRLAATGTLMGALLLAGSTVSSEAHGWRADRDLTSAAIPTGADPQVTDDAVDMSSTRARQVKADATAIGSTTCDGCTGDASTLQVLYLHKPRSATLDNVATAVSQCGECRSTALSVQVVVVRKAGTLAPNNRAFAINAGCEGCESSALAYQLVVVDDSGKRMSRREYRELKAWVAQQAEQMRAGSAGQRSLAPDDGKGGLDALESLVNDSLDSTTLVADVKKE